MNIPKSRFVFYSKSSDKEAGKGVNEILNPNDNFSDLNKIKDWRKKLSNMYISSFELADKKWNSVEHFFHSAKFMKHYSLWADTFTANSGSKWADDPFLAKNAGKAGRTNAKGHIYKHKEIMFPNNVKMRTDFYQGIHKAAMTMALYSKFTQNPELLKLLISTGDAELYHLILNRGKQNVLEHWTHLEKVRKCIKKYPIVKFDTNIVNQILNN